ncbi:MAG: hypothetical protein OXE02_04125, partial [Chloroflexi bacterium]|nr:hypothetical protein [Chloroflexota bacterium]
GGYSAESQACLTDLALQHPEIIFARLGIEYAGEASYQHTETHNVLLGFYDCMTDAEVATSLKDLYSAVDAASPLTGEDLVALLPESEAACVQETLSEAEYGALVNATPLRAAGLGASAADCLSLDSVVAFFVIASGAAVGGFSDESAACAEDFIRDRPGYAPILASYVTDESAQFSSADFAEVARGAFEAFECLNEDELGRIDEYITSLWG